MDIAGVAAQVPAVVEGACSADVVEAVIEEHRLSALRGEDAVKAPALHHLRVAGPAGRFVGGGEGETVANIEAGVAAFCRRIKTVLDGVAAVAAGIVDGMRPGVSGDEEQAFRRLLLQSDLQAMIDGTVAIAEHVDEAQEGKLIHEGTPGLLVAFGVVGVNVLVEIDDAVELCSLVADIGDGERSVLP